MNISRSHNLGIEEARRRVERVGQGLAEKHALQSEWRGNSLLFRGAGINGEVTVLNDSVEFDVKLGFMLKMMEGSLEQAINRALDSELG